MAEPGNALGWWPSLCPPDAYAGSKHFKKCEIPAPTAFILLDWYPVYANHVSRVRNRCNNIVIYKFYYSREDNELNL